MPVICPSCNQENLTGSLICAHCYALLVQVGKDQTGTTIQPPGNYAPPSIDMRKEAAENTVPTRLFKPDDPRFMTQRFEKHSSRLGPNMVAIYFDRMEEPLILEIVKHAILGRANTDPNNTEPWVDLTPYGAYEKGVSRKHALLRRTGNQIMIEDLESSNGSFLNNLPLKPYQASPIASGDRIRLSQLGFVVFIPG